MGVEIIVPVALFLSIIAIVLGPLWLRSRERRDMQETIRHALDKGQELPADLVEALAKASRGRVPTAHTDLRTGIIWLAISAGIATFGVTLSQAQGEAMQPMLGLAAVPGFLGLAYVILSFLNKSRPD